MLAKLIATKIIEERYEYSRVPRLLKKDVNNQLKQMGYEHLIQE